MAAYPNCPFTAFIAATTSQSTEVIKYNVAAVADGYVPSDNVEILLTSDNDNDWVKLNFQLEKSE